MKKSFEGISITPKAAEKLSHIGKCKLLQFVLIVWKECTIRNDDIAQKLKMSLMDVERLAAEAQNDGLTQTLRSKLETFYAIHDSVLNECPCKRCEFVSTGTLGNLSIVTCALKKKRNVDCFWSMHRICLGAISYLKDFGCVPISFSSVNAGKIVVNKLPENVDDWETGDFAVFLRNTHNKHWGHLYELPRRICQDVAVKLKKAFTVEFADKWRYVLKNYIRHSINRALGDGRRLSMLELKNPRNMQKFLNERTIYIHEKCKKKGIYCPYWESDCALTEGTCDDRFVDNIRKTFN